jgi:putative oxidoreductase
MTDAAARSRLLIPAFDRIYDALRPITKPLLRIVTGGFLLPHGYAKATGALAGTGEWLTSMGYSNGPLLATAIMCVELGAGLCVAIGFLTRPAAFAAMVFLLGAVRFHSANGFMWTNGGAEYPLFWAAACLFFVIQGGGRFSVDRAIGREF